MPNGKSVCPHIELGPFWFRLYEGALLLAMHHVREAGWRIRAVTEDHWIPGRAAESDQAVEYFHEAEAKGASLAFHRHPK